MLLRKNRAPTAYTQLNDTKKSPCLIPDEAMQKRYRFGVIDYTKERPLLISSKDMKTIHTTDDLYF